MKIEKFKKKCARWEYKSWNKGNLIEYWKKAGLTVEQIFRNKEVLSERSKTIAILGSVGKTTLSRILSNIIRQERYSYYLTKVNDNWLPQLPFAVELALKNDANFSIFECGVASKGDSSLMASVVPAHIIIYTEFAEVNLSEMGSLIGVAEEKIQFFLKNLYSKVISHFGNKYYFKKKGITAIYYGQKGSDAEFIYDLEEITDNSTIVKVINDSEILLKVNDVGLHIGPACCGAVAAYSQIMGRKLDTPYLEIDSYSNPRQRMQRVDYHGVKLIVDTANSNELSILNSLETLVRMNTILPKNAVIGEVYGLGNETDKIMKRVVEKMCEMGMNVFNTIHFVGKYFLSQQDEIRKKIHTTTQFYCDEPEFKTRFNIENYKNQIVLLRGPTKRGINLSNILKGYDGSSEETTPEEINRL